jgi:hypothetical protein
MISFSLCFTNIHNVSISDYLYHIRVVISFAFRFSVSIRFSPRAALLRRLPPSSVPRKVAATCGDCSCTATPPITYRDHVTVSPYLLIIVSDG